ncbi:hypothetical protein ACROYT_G034972 [Oculina patagonica]
MKILVVLSFVVLVMLCSCVTAEDCVFPFEYRGRTYHGCTYGNHNRPWCAWDNPYQSGRWSNCECNAFEESSLSCPSDRPCIPAAEGYPAYCSLPLGP